MKLRIIKEQAKVILDDNQTNFIRKGWGDAVIDGVDVYSILYHSDGYLIEGYLAKPNKINERLPLIVWNRGGDEKDGRLDDFLASGILGEIASWGYIVISSQYRQTDEFGGAEVSDVVNVLKAGMEIEEYDGENTGVEGWSRGGMITYLLLTRVKFLKCAISVAGLANLRRNFELNAKLKDKFLAKFSKYSPDMIAREMDLRSAVNFYGSMNVTTPLLMIHGTGDDKVTYKDSADLYRLLKPVYQSDIEIKLMENGDHYLRSHRKEVSTMRRNWFDKYLKLNN